MSDALRRAIRTALQTFTGIFAVSLLGFLSAVQEWAGGTGQFPSVNPLGKAAVAGIAAAAAGLVSLIVNKLEDSPKVALPALLKAVPSAGVDPVAVGPSGVDAPKAAPRKPAAKKKAAPVKKAAKKR